MTHCKRKTFPLIFLLLLLLCAVGLFACKEDDFYEKYAASSSVSQATGGTEDAVSLQEGEPKIDEESAEGPASDPVKNEDESKTEGDGGTVPQGGTNTTTQDETGKGTQEVHGSNENTVGTPERKEDLSAPTDDEKEQNPAVNKEQPPTTPINDQQTQNSTQKDQTQPKDSLDKDDLFSTGDEPNYGEIFDLSTQWGDYCLYKTFEATTEPLTLFVGRTAVGSVTVNETGDITFDCEFTESECELWGKWDQEGKIRTYVRFDTLDAFKEIVFSDAFAQIDLSAAEVESLRAPLAQQDAEPKEEQKDPQPQGGGAVGETGAPTPQENLSSDDTTEPGAQVPPSQEEQGASSQGHGATADLSSLGESKVYSLLAGLYGVAEKITVGYIDEEGEDYSFELKQMTSEDIASLKERLNPYETYPSEQGETIRKTFVLEGYSFTVSATLTEEAQGACATVKVVGISLSQ